MLALYHTPSTCSLASLICLEEAQADYTLRPIRFGREEQKAADYLAVNPKARVPSLVTERGVLTETPAILIYIAQKFPAANLAPLDDPFALAQLQAFTGYICSSLHVAHAHRMRGHRWTDDPMAMDALKRFVPESVSACFDYVENHAFVGPWSLGDDYSVVDPYLFTVAQWMENDGVDTDRFPKVVEHRERVRERPAVQKALENEKSAYQVEPE